MNEAETNVPRLALCEAVARALTFHPDLMPLREVVLQAIALVGGNRNRVLGLDVINQCFCSGLLELALLLPDGTMRWFSKTDCEHRTVKAAHNPAEAVYVEPYEDGQYFVRRATSPATVTPPADRQLPAEGGSTQSSQAQQPDESAIADPAPVSASAADVGDRAGAATAATETAGTQPKERRSTRGPPPEKRDLVANEIRDDIREKRFTMQKGRLFKDARRVPQKKLTERYDCGKSTLLDALRVVWSEFAETPTNELRPTPDNK